MTEPTLALQTAVCARLLTTPAVTDLVPAASIAEAPRRPEKFPTIIPSDGQTVDAELTYARQHVRAFLDLHIWTDEKALADHREIAGAVQTAIRSAPIVSTVVDLVDCRVTGTRFLRDPGGYGHAIVSVEALVGWRT